MECGISLLLGERTAVLTRLLLIGKNYVYSADYASTRLADVDFFSLALLRPQQALHRCGYKGITSSLKQ